MNVGGDVDRVEGLAVPLHRPTRTVDQELFKVPANVGALHRLPDDELGVAHEALGVVGRQRQRLLQPGEDGMFAVAVHLDLVEHVEVGLVVVSRPHVLQRVEDLLAVGVLLMAELVAGEGQDLESVAELLLELVKLGEVPRGRASQRRRVLDQHHFALQMRERELQ